MTNCHDKVTHRTWVGHKLMRKNGVMVYVSSILTTSTNIITMIITQTINNTVVDMTHVINLQSEGVLTRQDVLGIIETNKQCIIWNQLKLLTKDLSISG